MIQELKTKFEAKRLGLISFYQDCRSLIGWINVALEGLNELDYAIRRKVKHCPSHVFRMW